MRAVPASCNNIKASVRSNGQTSDELSVNVGRVVSCRRKQFNVYYVLMMW